MQESTTRIQRAKDLARQLLDTVGYEMPVDAARIAENRGLVIRSQPLEDTVSGMLVIKDGRTIIGINESHHPNRQRFSIAHELGHYLLHREQSSVFIDAVYYRDQTSSEGSRAQEIEANAFAAELLMPERVVREHFERQDMDMVDDVAIRRLASRWEVSAQALTIRLTSLGLITVDRLL